MESSTNYTTPDRTAENRGMLEFKTMPRHRYCLTFEAATAAAYLRSEDEADSSGRTEDDE